MSLGKGLESLIPKKSAGQSDDGAGGFVPSNSAPVPVPIASDFPAAQSPTTPPAAAGSASGSSGWPSLPEEPAIASEESLKISAGQNNIPKDYPATRSDRTVPRAAAKDPEKIGAVFHIEVSKIVPNPQQPRREFDEDALHDLARSIREFGILQPLVVSRLVKETQGGTDVEYQLIAGERRWLAARILGLEYVPAIVRDVDLEKEKLELAIIENLQRENLSPIEMGRAFAKLQDEFRLTQREIASRLGKSREVVANTVRLLDLPPAVQDAISRGQITESHGRLLLSVSDPAAQDRLFQDLLSQRLTTREFKDRVEHNQFKPPATSRRGRPPASPLPPEMRQLESRLASELGTPVKIQPTGDGGRITISFYSQEELDALLRRLGASE